MASRVGVNPRGSLLLASLLLEIIVITQRAESIPHGWLSFAESPWLRHMSMSSFRNGDPVRLVDWKPLSPEGSQDRGPERSDVEPSLVVGVLSSSTPRDAGSEGDQRNYTVEQIRGSPANGGKPRRIDRNGGHVEGSSASGKNAENPRNVESPLQTVGPFEARNDQQSQRLYEHHLATGTSAANEPMLADNPIIFPSDDMEKKVTQPVLKPAKGCNETTTFCEKPPYYPDDYVETTIRMQDNLRFLSRVDGVDIAERIDSVGDTPLCMSSETVVYPKTAENRQKEWLFILQNRKENFTQGVRIETCSNENQDCQIIEGFAEGYKTSCRQKYIYRQLAAIASNGTLITDMFRLPSSCCCHVKFTGNASIRMGERFGVIDQSPAANKRKK